MTRSRTSSIKELIKEGQELYRSGHKRKAINLFHKLQKSYPERADIWLQAAYFDDANGRESEAIPQYRRAIALGLKGKELKRALICLASSYRNVGQLAKARRTIATASKNFPDDPTIELFYALILCDTQDYQKAVRLLAFGLLRESKNRQLRDFRPVLTKRYRAVTK